jgi:hypothetical protein
MGLFWLICGSGASAFSRRASAAACSYLTQAQTERIEIVPGTK